jgi:hypothetical protein
MPNKPDDRRPPTAPPKDPTRRVPLTRAAGEVAPEQVASVPRSTEPGVAADPQEVFDRSVSEYESDSRRETGSPRPTLPSHEDERDERGAKRR